MLPSTETAVPLNRELDQTTYVQAGSGGARFPLCVQLFAQTYTGHQTSSPSVSLSGRSRTTIHANRLRRKAHIVTPEDLVSSAETWMMERGMWRARTDSSRLSLPFFPLTK